MSVLQVIVMVMVVTILATITLAAISYGAFKARERRLPAPGSAEEPGPLYFERVRFLPVERPAEPGS